MRQGLVSLGLTKDSNDKTDVKITAIMINKKVKTKFCENSNGRLVNPVPGTVLDHTITKGLYDFYLVSTICR